MAGMVGATGIEPVTPTMSRTMSGISPSGCEFPCIPNRLILQEIFEDRFSDDGCKFPLLTAACFRYASGKRRRKRCHGSRNERLTRSSQTRAETSLHGVRRHRASVHGSIPPAASSSIAQVRVGRAQRRVKIGAYGPYTVEQARAQAERNYPGCSRGSGSTARQAGAP